MEKYCESCGRVFDDLNFKLCPYCGSQLATRQGRENIPRQLRHQVFQRDGYRCRECGASNDETVLEIDHIVPVARGGTNDIENLQTLCRECNRMKYTDEWVGGETNLEMSQKRLLMIDEQIKQANVALSNASTEDEKIDYKFFILKLNEEKTSLQIKIDELIDEAEENKKQEIEDERRARLYKKLYVRFSDEDYFKTVQNYFEYGRYYTKDDFIIGLINTYSTEENINNAIEHMKNELIKREQRGKELKIKREQKQKELEIKRKEKIGTMFCPNCGKEILKNAIRCKYCHYSFKKYSNKKSSKKSTEKPSQNYNNRKGLFGKLFSR